MTPLGPNILIFFFFKQRWISCDIYHVVLTVSSSFTLQSTNVWNKEKKQKKCVLFRRPPKADQKKSNQKDFYIYSLQRFFVIPIIPSNYNYSYSLAFEFSITYKRHFSKLV